MKKSDLETDAKYEGRCSCAQALWYLDILKRFVRLDKEHTKFAGSFGMGEMLARYEEMLPEIRRAIKLGHT